MDKGINLYLSKKFDQETLLDMFSKSGFDSVILPFDFVERYKEKTSEILASKNLKMQMVHCRYDAMKLDRFWEDDKRGEELFDDYIYQLEIVKNVAPVDFIIHLVNSPGEHYSEIGKDRLKLLVKKAKECNIRLCVENTFSTYQQTKIFEDINDENLKMCYDSGHENWLTPKDDLLSLLGDKVVQLHLHNNDGIYDHHQPIFEGIIDFDKKAKQLANLGRDFGLCAELKFVDDRLSVDFLKGVKSDLEKLEKMIEKYKQKR